MRVEQLDQLHVPQQRTDQITAAAPHEIGGRERVQQQVEADAQLGEQPVRQVMRDP